MKHLLLRDEFEFIDNYLDIEVIRFGREKLRVVKELIRRRSMSWCPACSCSHSWKTRSSMVSRRKLKAVVFSAKPGYEQPLDH